LLLWRSYHILTSHKSLIVSIANCLEDLSEKRVVPTDTTMGQKLTKLILSCAKDGRLVFQFPF